MFMNNLIAYKSTHIKDETEKKDDEVLHASPKTS